jgi:hypothetical protein
MKTTAEEIRQIKQYRNNNHPMLHLLTLLAQVNEYELDCTFDFLTEDENVLVKVYNGAGADWMSGFSRKIITFLLILFEPCFLIHDYDFYKGDKTLEGFKTANKRMWLNMRKILGYKYPIYNPFLWVSRAKWWIFGWLAYRACTRGGWSAWVD